MNAPPAGMRRKGRRMLSKMVIMSLEQYSQLTGNIEEKLDEADRIAASTEERYSHEEVFSAVRGRINDRRHTSP